MSKDFFVELRDTLATAGLLFNVVGAVVFGSRVKGTAALYSDFDILVVAEGISPKLHRRKNEILCLKDSLPPLPFDILLLTPREVISNFANHNPLFLDIAEDGVVFLDKENLLSTLISETKTYIRTRRIKRLKGGWEFPVKQGVATYLSPVSNKEFIL